MRVRRGLDAIVSAAVRRVGFEASPERGYLAHTGLPSHPKVEMVGSIEELGCTNKTVHMHSGRRILPKEYRGRPH